MATHDKQYAIGMVVSCKRSGCSEDRALCAHCVENFIGESIYNYSHFALSQATTTNNSKQFVVSFIAGCRKPDCATAPITSACCTASAEKCEMCLRTIVSRGIREMYGFHAKEIVVA